MAKPAKKPNGKGIVVVDGAMGITAEEEHALIEDYLNQGYTLLFVRTVVIDLMSFKSVNREDGYSTIQPRSYPRYYFGA